VLVASRPVWSLCACMHTCVAVGVAVAVGVRV